MRIVLTLTALISCKHFFLQVVVDADSLADKIELRLYKNGKADYQKAKLSQGEELFQETKGYRASLPIILVIHGEPKGADCPFVDGLIEAFVKRKLTDQYNIIAVDMPDQFKDMGNPLFVIKSAGQTIGKFLSQAITHKLIAYPGRINIIGFSAGAQAAGFAARIVKDRNKGKIYFIASLNPFGFQVFQDIDADSSSLHVSKEDATITYSYHTDAFYCGTTRMIATADFIFNPMEYNRHQPGCSPIEMCRANEGRCNHNRVIDLYIEAVANPKSFVARQCDSLEHFVKCYAECKDSQTVFITFPPESVEGLYFLSTSDKTPFALAESGSRCGSK